MSSEFTIMCFSWNASGLRICEMMSQKEADKLRSGLKGRMLMKKPCIAPDFFSNISELLRLKSPSLVAICTEDEDKKDTYFHSDFLPFNMAELGYTKLKREKLDGSGQIASGGKFKNVPTGDPSGGSLRLSIYAKDTVAEVLILQEAEIKQFFANQGQLKGNCKQGDKVSGAIVSYVWHPVFGKFAFIGVNIADGVTGLKISENLSSKSAREAKLSANKLCLISIIHKFVEDDKNKSEAKPNHVFLMGDLNYDLVLEDKKGFDLLKDISADISVSKIKGLHQYDELKQALSSPPLEGFKEGVSGDGPLFMPNWRLKRNRPLSCVPSETTTAISPNCYDNDNIGIGWHDRILYKEYIESPHIIHCLAYNILAVGNINASDHAAVIGLYEVKSIDQLSQK